MARVLVIGATGRQGGAVASQLVARGHEVDAFVRSLRSPAALALASKGIRLVPGDLDDADSLAAAAARVDAVFGLSIPFEQGGRQQEIEQGTRLVDVCRDSGVHLVYSSVHGADLLEEGGIDHADSKKVVEAHLRTQEVKATVIRPVYFMDNALNIDFNGLREGVYRTPLSPGKRLDQVAVADIAAMAVYSIENPKKMIGAAVDVASESVTGQESARILSEVLGREVPYEKIPLEDIRQWAGPEIATMYEAFEANEDFIDTATLHAAYPTVAWHTFETWARTIDWEEALSTPPKGW